LVKSLFFWWNQRAVFMKDKLEKELVSVEIDSAAANLSPKDRNIVGSAKIKINLLFHILVIPDTNIRCCRREENQRLLAQFPKGVVDKLRVLPWYLAKIIQIQILLL
jgi:hypothetical protein